MGVQNSDWGPPLWRILHVAAEKLGRQAVPLLATDEVRAWIQFLRDTEHALPCAMCRGHYRTWRQAHPLEQFQGLRGEMLRAVAREWLWLLHENVNDRREVSAEARVSFDTLEDRYGGAAAVEQAQKDVETLVRMLQEATQLRLVEGAAVRAWRGRLSMLRRLVGF